MVYLTIFTFIFFFYIIIWFQIFLQQWGEIEKTFLSPDFLFEPPLFEVSILAVVRAWGRDTYLIRIDRRVTETEMEGNQSWTGLPKSILNLRWSFEESSSGADAQTWNFHRNTMQKIFKFFPCFHVLLFKFICGITVSLMFIFYIKPSTDIITVHIKQ